MTLKLICAPLAFAALLAVMPGAAGEPAKPENRSFDLDLSALYRAAAAQGAPVILWQPDAARSRACDALWSTHTSLAFSFADCPPRPDATGHILDWPPPRG